MTERRRPVRRGRAAKDATAQADAPGEVNPYRDDADGGPATGTATASPPEPAAPPPAPAPAPPPPASAAPTPSEASRDDFAERAFTMPDLDAPDAPEAPGAPDASVASDAAAAQNGGR